MFGKAKIPVVLITGHLGSGKTTLLNHYLASTQSSRTAVIINEFGMVALDHQLVRQTTENIVLLENGCICCTVRADLVETLKSLCSEVKSHGLPRFELVVIETTGVERETPFDWDAISDWIEALVADHGPNLLRVKGLLNVADPEDRPLVLHGIQHLFHPPEPLPAWPSEDRRSRIIFIVDGVDQADVEARLDAACMRQAVA
jgi:G3E family GTPase